jgi:two-component system, NtrC family, response regulator AtoC
LIESELFGYEKGAFTGASSRKTGLFEAADGGTVFLDELGEMPLQLQVKLLRALQESEIVRVGGTDPVKFDIRIIAATNKDLKVEVNEGRFRSDLFFRLNVLSILIPPLRERSDDILLLAEYFVRKYSARIGKDTKILSGEARENLAAHLWPGNIRELENVIQKAVVLSDSNKISKDDIELSPVTITKSEEKSPERIPTIRAARELTERDVIQKALRATMGNVTHTSRILEIDRKWLLTKMSEYGIEADIYRKGLS